MSSFFKRTKNPATGRWEEALWIDDHFGQHRYGVEFPDGTIVDPEIVKLETTDESVIRVAPHPKRAKLFGPSQPDRVIPFNAESPAEIFARKYKELLSSLTRIRREAALADINIVEISIPDRWYMKYPDLEKDMLEAGFSDRLLGLNIKQ